MSQNLMFVIAGIMGGKQVWTNGAIGCVIISRRMAVTV
jgi:hypothetical protein